MILAPTRLTARPSAGGEKVRERLRHASSGRARKSQVRAAVRAAIEAANCDPVVTAAIEALYPEAVPGSVFRRYLAFVLFTSPLRDETTGEIRFGEFVQMAIAGKSFNGGTSGRDFVQHLKERLPGFEIRPGSRSSGREQTILDDGIDPRVWTAVRAALASPAPKRIYIVTGKVRRDDDATDERRRLLDVAMATPAPSETAAFVRDRMNARAPNLFTRNLDFAPARAYASTEL